MSDKKPTGPKSAAKQKALREEQVQQIVAYLDGELDAEETARVERRLGMDESFRKEMQGIEKAWSALGSLPVATVDDSFSKTTLELVTGEARRTLETGESQRPREKTARGGMSWVGAAAALVLGFLVLRLITGAPNRLLLRDLPSIQYLDAYSQIEGAEFLRALDREFAGKLWAPEVTRAELESELAEFHQVVDSTTREAYLEGLDRGAKTSLRVQLNRFFALPSEEQERIRSLHAEVASAPESEGLAAAMLQFRHWYAGLEEHERFQLREVAERSSGASLAKEVGKAVRRQGIVLDDRELKQFEEILNKQWRVRGEEHRGADERGQGPALASKKQFDRLRQIASDRRRRRELMIEVVQMLSPEKRERLASLTPPEKVRVFQGWMKQLHEKLSPASRGDGIPATDLERFFVEDLAAGRRAELLAEPTSRMERMLRRAYITGSDEPDEGSPGFKPGPGRFDQPPPRRFEERPRDGRRPSPERFGPQGREFPPEGGPRRGRPPGPRDERPGPPG